MTLLAMLVFSTVAFAADANVSLSSADEVIARVMQHDENQQATLNGYTSLRRYVLENLGHHKRAEMLVRVTCQKDGSKAFEAISSSGWGSARKHVFPKLLEGEAEASRASVRDQSRIIPQNYSFELIGTESVNDRPAYVITITPKEAKKYLVHAKVWIDAQDYAIVRMEGRPAKSPSFWIKSVQFVHRYQKHGPFWFPVSDRSVTDARFFGATEVTIEYFEYAPDIAPADRERTNP